MVRDVRKLLNRTVIRTVQFAWDVEIRRGIGKLECKVRKEVNRTFVSIVHVACDAELGEEVVNLHAK